MPEYTTAIRTMPQTIVLMTANTFNRGLRIPKIPNIRPTSAKTPPRPNKLKMYTRKPGVAGFIKFKTKLDDIYDAIPKSAKIIENTAGLFDSFVIFIIPHFPSLSFTL